jgi:hypothetical protein
MLLDARVGRVDEHRAQVFDVRLEATHLVPVGPVYEDILGVALVQLLGLLVFAQPGLGGHHSGWSAHGIPF